MMTMTVGDALMNAQELEDAILRKKNVEAAPERMRSKISHTTDSLLLNERSVLHAGILRRAMSCCGNNRDKYISINDLSCRECAEFVSDHVYDFMQWLVDSHAYNAVLFCDNSNKDNISVLSICHQLIALTQKCQNPITLGLALPNPSRIWKQRGD